MDGHDGGGHDGFGHGGHADMGHGHGHGMSDLDATGHGHGVGDADAFAHSGHITAEALMVSHSHCHGAGWGDTFGHFSMDSSHGFHHGPDFGVINGEAEGRKAFRNKLEKAKIDPRRTFFGAHVVGHGYSETTRIFANLAKANGLVRVCDTVGNFNPVDLMVMELTDWNKYVGPFNRKFPTGGWYKGANGLTTIWKQYWQVGTQRPWWDPFGRVKYNRLKATYLEVCIVTWYYSDIGDYETRIDINVMSTPVLDPVDKQWGWRKTPLAEHQDAARKIIDGLFNALVSNKPDELILGRRRKMYDAVLEARRLEEEAAKKRIGSEFTYGSSGADIDALFEPEAADQEPDGERVDVVIPPPVGIVKS